MPSPLSADIPLALYVHIPWCERKCPYCDFNSHEHFQPSREGEYVDALLADLDDQCAGETRSLVSVFIGGGTPSLFSAAAISRLLAGVRQRLPLASGAEVTLESNPGSAEADRYQGYRAGGVNRLSIGVQSFDDTLLGRLGRVHNGAEAEAALALARSAGFSRFNVDLMHGLPGQDITAARDDTRRALDAGATHISRYQLTIEPNTRFYSHPPTLPVEDLLEAIEAAGETELRRAGLGRYEVSAWSTPGEESRHNLNYWHFGDYLGIGAGAHGKLTGADGSIVRTRRTRQPDDYLRAIVSGQPPLSETLAPGRATAEFFMNALRLEAGFPRDLLTRRTGADWGEVAAKANACVDAGLMDITDDWVRPTELGGRFLDDLVSRFLD